MTITIDFGAVHQTCISGADQSSATPAGLPHFMEHFLFWLQFRNLVLPIEHDYVVGPNAMVSFDCTRWGISNAVVDHHVAFHGAQLNEEQFALGLMTLVRRLFNLLIPTDDLKAGWQKVIARTVADIENEILERHSDRGYRLQCHLRQVMFAPHPISNDILGTKESIKLINESHIQSALSSIRSNIRSVTILCKSLSTVVRDRIAEELCRLFHEQILCHVPKHLTISPVQRQLGTRQGFLHLESARNTTLLIGAHLPPIATAYPEPELQKRATVATYLAQHRTRETESGGLKELAKPALVVGRPALRLPAIVSHYARLYMASAEVPRPAALLDPMTLHNLGEDAKRQLVKQLIRLGDNCEYVLQYALSEHYEHPHQIVRLCNAADDAGLDFWDFVETLSRLTVADLKSLATELSQSKDNLALVYAGQALDDI